MASNLPPGTTAADIDRHYSGSTPAHDHEWMPERDIIIEESVNVIFHCGFVEITGSTTSARHDETFYEEGAECEATKRVQYTVTAETPDGEQITYEDDPAVYEGLIPAHAPDIKERFRAIDLHDPEERVVVTLDPDGTPNEIVLVCDLGRTNVEG